MLLSFKRIKLRESQKTPVYIILCNWMSRRDDQVRRVLRKKHKSVITMGLKNTWPEIIESQRMGQDHRKDNRHRENLRNRFWQQELYLHRKKIASWQP